MRKHLQLLFAAVAVMFLGAALPAPAEAGTWKSLTGKQWVKVKKTVIECTVVSYDTARCPKDTRHIKNLKGGIAGNKILVQRNEAHRYGFFRQLSFSNLGPKKT